MNRTDMDMHSYVHDLEEHLQLTLFGGGSATDPESAVLLVRGALAAGNQAKAARLAAATERLAAIKPSDCDLMAAADHARGLAERNPVAIDRAAARYQAPRARAWAAEDAGMAWAERGNQTDAVTRLRQAHALYEQIGAADSMARVRSRLRAAGIRLRHWTHADRPTVGWASLTDTERRIVDLVAQGLSNRQVASQMFLSSHTIAFHLRHVFWKLNVTSRVQLASLAAAQARSSDSHVSAAGHFGRKVPSTS